MNDKQLRQAIDSCRSGSQDVNAPELIELSKRLAESPELRATYDRVQSADRCLAKALDDVAVPANLADRLLARLQATGPQTTGTGIGELVTTAVNAAEKPPQTSEVVSSAAEITRAPQPVRHMGRRAAVAALAASVLAMLGWWGMQPRPISSDDMPELVTACYDQLSDQWQSMPSAPKGLAVPRGIAIKARDWQDVSSSFGNDAVAYRFMLGGGNQAVLFAVNMKLERVPGMPPSRPQPMTGARSIAVWQSAGVVYVLVLNGDPRDYQRMFKSQPGATA